MTTIAVTVGHSSATIEITARRGSAPETENTPVRWENVVTQLVAERGETLTHYAYLISGNRDDTSDLIHDALVKTFGRLRNGFSITSAETYVRRSILNTYLDRGSNHG